MDIFGILDPDPHKNVCGYETLDFEDVNTLPVPKQALGNIWNDQVLVILKQGKH